MKRNENLICKELIERAISNHGNYINVAKEVFIIDKTVAEWKKGIDKCKNEFYIFVSRHVAKNIEIDTTNRYFIIDLEYGKIDSAWQTIEEVFERLKTC